MTEMTLSIGPIGVALLMAAVTYAWRVGGFHTMGLVNMTPRVKRGLQALPGAIIVATVLPMLAKTGLAGAIAIASAAACMIVVRSEALAVVVGAVVAAGLRFLL
jgi:uncharacterized membrane protein